MHDLRTIASLNERAARGESIPTGANAKVSLGRPAPERDHCPECDDDGALASMDNYRAGRCPACGRGR